MTKLRSYILVVLVLFSTGIFACSKQAEVPEPDREKLLDADTVRLAVCHPSLGSIRALQTLREKGLFDIENLHVTGIYHGAEKRIYSEAVAFVQENKLEWITFLELDEAIPADELFQRNNLSDNFQDIFSTHDGLILFGGSDIPPYVYGRETSLLTEIGTPVRSLYETSFVFHLLGGYQDPSYEGYLERNPEYPILGICLGSQTLNVGTGGTLVQDIWSEIYGRTTYEGVTGLPRDAWHTNPYSRIFPELRLIGYNLHPVRLLPEGKFVTEMGFSPEDSPYIMSAHHQSAGEIGKDFRVISTSMDGRVVEAVEHLRFPNVLGVQFHPEFPMLYDEGRMFKITPGDEKETSAPEILRSNAPSFRFHEKIWAWFADRLSESHTRESGK